MILSLILFLIAPMTQASEKPVYSRADFPCTQTEEWFYGKSIPESTISSLKQIGRSRSSALEGLVTAYKLRSSTARLEVRNLADYSLYRAYFDLGLVHLAHRGFSSIALGVSSPDVDGVRLAALGCLNLIHRKFPSLKLPATIASAFVTTDIRKIWPDQRKQLWEGITSASSRKISEKGGKSDLTTELQLLSNGAAYSLYVQANHSANQDTDQKTIFSFEELLKTKKLPESIQTQKDGIYLNLARAYYNTGNFTQAIKYFKSVKHDSNLLTQALIGLAWGYYRKNTLSDAVGSAYNLMAGELQNTFVPDAPLVASMALFETCHYKEAIDSIRYFRKTYDPSYRWLYNWYSQLRKGAPSGPDLYTLTTDAIRTKKSIKVPENIVSEWVRSPVFLIWQQEINLLLDEKQIAQELLKELYREVGKKQKPSAQLTVTTLSLKSGIYNIIFGFYKEIPLLEQALIQGINHEFTFLNRYMISRWVESFENSQLVEVEIFDATGENIIKKTGGAPGTHPKDGVRIKHDDDGLPVLDWGKFDINTKEKSEIWEDEVGFLKTDLNNICPVKK